MIRLVLLTLLPAFLLVFTQIGNQSLLSIITNGFSLIDTMFHELGHTICSWIFGYPSLPSFDLEYGGGMSYYFGRSWLLQGAGFLGAAYICYLAFNSDRKIFYVSLAVSTLYILSAVTGFHHVLIDFMGHGFSILTGSYFLLRAFLNWTEPRPLEKEISAFLGYFMIFANMKLCWKLIFDLSYQEEYWNQKGSHGFGDFSKIADYLWFTTEKPVAWFCLFLCIILLILPHIFYYFRNLPDRLASSR